MSQQDNRPPRAEVDFNARSAGLVRARVTRIDGVAFVGDRVVLQDSDDGIEADATLTRVDSGTGLAYFDVSWESARRVLGSAGGRTDRVVVHVAAAFAPVEVQSGLRHLEPGSGEVLIWSPRGVVRPVATYSIDPPAWAVTSESKDVSREAVSA